jgi:copper chaperone
VIVMATSVYSVRGMHCGHCAASVTEEVSQLPGVTDVAVDVPAGLVTITSAQPLEQSAVAAAVDEAGYTLTGTVS